MPIFLPKMSLFCSISFKLVKKITQRRKNGCSLEKSTYFFRGYDKSIEESSQRKKSGCHPSKNRYLTMKTLMKKYGTSKNTFWGQIPIFSLERSTYFFRGYDKSIEESSQRKKSGCHPSNDGYLPINHLQNTKKHNFLQYRNKKDLQMGVLRLQTSFFDRIWPKESLLCDISEQNGVLEAL